MAASTEIRSLIDGLWIIEKTRQLGYITTGMIAKAPGWNRIRAWRYVNALVSSGWLEKGDRRRYYLGPTVRRFVFDPTI